MTLRSAASLSQSLSSLWGHPGLSFLGYRTYIPWVVIPDYPKGLPLVHNSCKKGILGIDLLVLYSICEWSWYQILPPQTPSSLIAIRWWWLGLLSCPSSKDSPNFDRKRGNEEKLDPQIQKSWGEGPWSVEWRSHKSLQFCEQFNGCKPIASSWTISFNAWTVCLSITDSISPKFFK